ncbi:MAG: hypothetical protein COA79_01025 [Planctomycetota bacterium]|nr:MAG: hypothetical protein COA79_01025 [Planctomycetota bacterium]
MPILKILKSNQQIEVATKKVVIGRHSGDDLTLNDAKSSRSNTEIEYKNKKYFIRDRGSRNGTFVNGTKIEEALELKYGDKILIGTSELEFIKTPEKINLELIGYEIIEHVASGGMGKVYKARQVSLDRTVAVKVLSPKFTSDKRLTENFINEARSAGRLNHPNLVQVHDVNKDFQKDGSVVYYFSMEYVDGQTIKEIIRDQEKLSYLYTIDLLIATCLGLEYIHSNNLVHRDIKPDNLMLDSDQTLKIADLGIALNVEESTGEDITEDGQRRVVGTPHYISPEQARGRKIDHRSDIYSLGATAFHMLTGDTLYDGDNARDIIKKHVNTEPRLVSDVESKVPKLLSELINSMLAKDIKDRPQTAKELREELEDLKLRLQKNATGFRAGKQKNQHKKSPLMFSLIAVILGVIFAFMYLFLTSVNTDDNIKNINNNNGEQNNDTMAILQSQISQAQNLSDQNKYEEAINIFNKLKSQHPENDQIVILLKKTKVSRDSYNSEKIKNNFNNAYTRILEEAQSPDSSNLLALESKLKIFINKYKNTEEAKQLKKELKTIQKQIHKEQESSLLLNYQNEINSIKGEEKQIEHLKKNKKRFYQKESKSWFDNKINSLNHKLLEQVRDANKSARNINAHINANTFDFAMKQAKSYLENYEYSVAKNVILSKIADIEKKANNFKNGIIKKTNMLLNDDFDSAEAKLIIESNLSKLEGTKAHGSLKGNLNKILSVRRLHSEVCKFLDGSELIDLYPITEGFKEVRLKSKTANEEKIDIQKVYDANTNKERTQKLSKSWSSIDRAKIYKIYESVLRNKKSFKKYSKALETFKKIFKVKESDLKALD